MSDVNNAPHPAYVIIDVCCHSNCAFHHPFFLEYDVARFAPSVAPLTVYAFLGMFNYSYTWFDPSGERTPDEIADHFVDVFLNGVLIKPT